MNKLIFAPHNHQLMTRYTLLTLFIAMSSIVYGQLYDDYLGAGHDKGIKVWSSSNQGAAIAANTINGVGLDAKKIEATRFLAQAAFGGSEADVAVLLELDNNFDAWIEDQFTKETSWMLPKLWEVNEKAERLYYMEYDTLKPGREDFDYFGPFFLHFEYSWWDNLMKGDDQLRQRVAYALSQIFVISINSQLSDYGEGLSSYYDHFMSHGFGNYKDLMLAVTLDPNMGFYLSHLNNQKTNVEDNINPDENYARETMQLFSIGLYQLNNDGTRKTDAQDEWIPTYDNNHIKGLAKVMTGLKGGKWSESAVYYGADPNTEVEFGVEIGGIDKTVPLVMDDGFHEPGAKTILDDFVIPAGQTGMQDIEMAVDYLFNHDNVGPFVARRLIQQLVKSNPTPAYVNRVANAFNGNGGSTRGDMETVIKAVLLDEEARSCEALSNPLHGKLREPMLRFTHLLKAIPTVSESGDYWNASQDFYNDTKQIPLRAPSVFNFYLPDFQAGGEITDAGAVSPEFQIHNTQTAMGYIHQVHKWTQWGVAFWDWTGREDCKDDLYDENRDPDCEDLTPNVDFVWDELTEKADDIETLINYLDVMMMHGRMSSDTREIIADACEPVGGTEQRARLALYLVMISPDFVILK